MYDERAIQAVLQRAAELEQAAATQNEPTLSHEEVMRLGREAGISATAMQQAIDDVSARSVLSRFRAHAPSQTTSQRLAVPMTDTVWRGLVEQLRARFNAVGTVYHIGAAREWHFTREETQLVVAIRPDGDGTRVTAFAQRQPDPWRDLPAVAFGLVDLIIAFIFPVVMATMIVIGIIGLLYPLIRRYLQHGRLAKRLAHVQAAARAIEAQHDSQMSSDGVAAIPLGSAAMSDA